MCHDSYEQNNNFGTLYYDSNYLNHVTHLLDSSESNLCILQVGEAKMKIKRIKKTGI
jgi:hypothetical protein